MIPPPGGYQRDNRETFGVGTRPWPRGKKTVGVTCRCCGGEFEYLTKRGAKPHAYRCFDCRMKCRNSPRCRAASGGPSA